MSAFRRTIKSSVGVREIIDEPWSMPAIGSGLGGDDQDFLSFSRRDAKKVVHYLINSLSSRAPIAPGISK
jgi:hypothetical protein